MSWPNGKAAGATPSFRGHAPSTSPASTSPACSSPLARSPPPLPLHPPVAAPRNKKPEIPKKPPVPFSIQRGDLNMNEAYNARVGSDNVSGDWLMVVTESGAEGQSGAGGGLGGMGEKCGQPADCGDLIALDGVWGKGESDCAVSGCSEPAKGVGEATTKKSNTVDLFLSVGTHAATSDTVTREGTQLCGYMNKYKVGARRGVNVGPLVASLPKIFKRRWFVFVDTTCGLFYYRSPPDLIPLGQIDIATATFSFDPSAADSRAGNIFEIRSGEKSYLLEVEDRHTMLYWLQELQLRRKLFHRRKNLSASGGNQSSTATGGPLIVFPSGGSGETDPEGPSILASVSTPEGTVGPTTAVTGARLALRDLSITNWKVEIRNLFLTVGGGLGGTIRRPKGSKGSIPDADMSQVRWSQIDQESDPVIGTLVDTETTANSPSLILSSSLPSSIPPSNAPSGSIPSSVRSSGFSSSSASSAHSGGIWSRGGGGGGGGSEGVGGGGGGAGHAPGLATRFSSLKRKFRPAVGGGASVKEAGGASDTATMCVTCKQFEDKLHSSRRETAYVENELQAVRSFNSLLRIQGETMQRQLEAHKEFVGVSAEVREYVDAIGARDARIVYLEHMLADALDKQAVDESRLGQLRNELKSDRDDIEMYVENLQLKDQIVMALSERVLQLEQTAPGSPHQQGGQNEGQESIGPASNSITAAGVGGGASGRHGGAALEMEQLRDHCVAYKLQNAFLNQEIMEVDQLLKDEQARNEILTQQLNLAEARYYQVKSKHIYCLKELSKPQQGGTESYDQETVSRLLQDALNSYEGPTGQGNDLQAGGRAMLTSRGANSAYDEYGFLRQWTRGRSAGGIDPESLESFAENLQQRSEESQHRAMALGVGNVDAAAVAAKFERYLIVAGDRPLPRSQELKELMRDGVPTKFRGRVWKACIDLRVNRLKDYYISLRRQSTAARVHHQVEIDLLRTLPNNRHYAMLESDGISRLRNVLLAFAVHKPDVGYCQGLNRIVAILLLFLDEEDAFWGLVTIVECLMPACYYDHTLIAAHADQRVLKDLVAEKLPLVAAHFATLNFDLTLFAFSWFLTLFVDNIPVETYLRIWDAFLYEGSKVLFRYAVAVLRHSEEAILACKDLSALHAYMRSMGETLWDISRIARIAFHELNPFPMRNVSTKRQQHLQKLKMEMAEMEAQRRNFESSIRRDRLTDDSTVSDDDA